MLWIGIVLLTCLVVATIGRPSLRNTEVCGSDGVTYRDVDELESARMENTDLELLYDRACDFPDKILRDNRETVYCGSDNKTYNSYLDLLVEKFKKLDLVLKHSGPCENTTANIISLRTVDTSVCATNFRTYYDIEKLQSAQFFYPELRILHSGQCVIPMLYQSGYLRCVDCLFDSLGLNAAKNNAVRSCGRNGVENGTQNAGDGGNEGNCASNGGNDNPLTQSLNQIAHGVFNIIGGSLGINKGIGLPLLGQSGCQRNCIVHG